MSETQPKPRNYIRRTPDGRKVFGLIEIGREIGRNPHTVSELLCSGELDVCHKDGKIWWAFVKDLDRWQTERSASSAKRG